MTRLGVARIHSPLARRIATRQRGKTISGSGLAMNVDERHASSSGGHVKSTIITISLANRKRSVLVALTPGVQKSWARTRKRTFPGSPYVRLMLVYVVRRFFHTIPVLAISSFLSFVFVSLAGDPLGQLRQNPRISQVTRRHFRPQSPLDEPIPVRYVHWVHDVFTNGLGVSLNT